MVRIKLFSVLKQEAQSSELDVSWEEGMTGDSLLLSLSQSHPSFRKYLPYIRVAVNNGYIGRDQQIMDGDIVTLITPVSGG